MNKVLSILVGAAIFRNPLSLFQALGSALSLSLALALSLSLDIQPDAKAREGWRKKQERARSNAESMRGAGSIQGVSRMNKGEAMPLHADAARASLESI